MDERDAFLNVLRASLGANDNVRPEEPAESSHYQSQSSINLTGNTINIGKLELSVVLADSKKKITDRAILLALRELFLSVDNHSKKAPSYPQVDSTQPNATLKKNQRKCTNPLVNTTFKKNLKQPSFNDHFAQTSRSEKTQASPIGANIKKTLLARVIQCKEWNALFHNNAPLSLHAL